MKFRIAFIAIVSLGFFTACSGGSESAEKDEAVAQQAVEKAETTEAAETAEEPAAEPESQSQTMGAMHAKMMERCPMHVEGTKLSVEKTDKGIAMMFTNEANVAEVRTRAMKMAEHHETAMQDHGSTLPLYDLKAEKAAKGAKLMMHAQDPANVKALQNTVMQKHQAQGEMKCPMKLMYEMGGMKHEGGMHDHGTKTDG